MIERGHGSLLDADADALVNSVNCVGVMGKGVALLVKQAYPHVYEAYRRACRVRQVKPGSVLTVPTGRPDAPRFVINFPTKRHWKGRSRLDDIRAGLPALVAETSRLGVRSVAVPALGCGNGGLDWDVVRPLIVDAFKALPDVRVVLFDPEGPVAAGASPIREPAGLPLSQALLLRLMNAYRAPGYRLSLREVQHLAYFLQIAGESLGFRFTRNGRRPTPAEIASLLRSIEGQYIRALDPTHPDAEIELLPGVGEAADQVIARFPAARERLIRVIELIDGFQTPYGIELLAAVHRTAAHEPLIAADMNETMTAIRGAGKRAQRMFRTEHLAKAWQRLRDHHMLAGAPVTAKHLAHAV